LLLRGNLSSLEPREDCDSANNLDTPTVGEFKIVISRIKSFMEI